MTHEDKELLIKDLCARLPYGVEILADIEKEFDGGAIGELVGILPYNGEKYDIKEPLFYQKGCLTPLTVEEIKPYLRPIKSMTPDECDKLFKILDIREDSGEWLKINDIGVLRLFTESGKDFYEIAEAMDYLYSIHIDFRGLIELGLALEAPEEMYETK